MIAYYLLHLHDPFDVGLPPIGHVVTVASPLYGSALRGAWEAAGSISGIVGEAERSDELNAPSRPRLSIG